MLNSATSRFNRSGPLSMPYGFKVRVCTLVAHDHNRAENS